MNTPPNKPSESSDIQISHEEQIRLVQHHKVCQMLNIAIQKKDEPIMREAFEKTGFKQQFIDFLIDLSSKKGTAECLVEIWKRGGSKNTIDNFLDDYAKKFASVEEALKPLSVEDYNPDGDYDSPEDIPLFPGETISNPERYTKMSLEELTNKIKERQQFIDNKIKENEGNDKYQTSEIILIRLEWIKRYYNARLKVHNKNIQDEQKRRKLILDQSDEQSPSIEESIKEAVDDLSEKDTQPLSDTSNAEQLAETATPLAPETAENPKRMVLNVVDENGIIISQDFFDGKKIKIGKGLSCDFKINSEKVNVVHAVIETLEDENLYIIDLGSITGTYVNGQISNKILLKHGDIIQIGDTKILFDFISLDEKMRDIGSCAQELSSKKSAEEPEIITDKHGIEVPVLKHINGKLVANSSLKELGHIMEDLNYEMRKLKRCEVLTLDDQEKLKELNEDYEALDKYYDNRLEAEPGDISEKEEGDSGGAEAFFSTQSDHPTPPPSSEPPPFRPSSVDDLTDEAIEESESVEEIMADTFGESDFDETEQESDIPIPLTDYFDLSGRWSNPDYSIKDREEDYIRCLEVLQFTKENEPDNHEKIESMEADLKEMAETIKRLKEDGGLSEESSTDTELQETDLEETDLEEEVVVGLDDIIEEKDNTVMDLEPDLNIEPEPELDIESDLDLDLDDEETPLPLTRITPVPPPLPLHAPEDEGLDGKKTLLMNPNDEEEVPLPLTRITPVPPPLPPSIAPSNAWDEKKTLEITPDQAREIFATKPTVFAETDNSIPEESIVSADIPAITKEISMLELDEKLIVENGHTKLAIALKGDNILVREGAVLTIDIKNPGVNITIEKGGILIVNREITN